MWVGGCVQEQWKILRWYWDLKSVKEEGSFLTVF